MFLMVGNFDTFTQSKKNTERQIFIHSFTIYTTYSLKAVEKLEPIPADFPADLNSSFLLRIADVTKNSFINNNNQSLRICRLVCFSPIWLSVKSFLQAKPPL